MTTDYQKLLNQYNEYWNNEECDIDLANSLVNSVPKLISKIKCLEAYADALDNGAIVYKGQIQYLNNDVAIKFAMGDNYQLNDLKDLADIVCKGNELGIFDSFKFE